MDYLEELTHFTLNDGGCVLMQSTGLLDKNGKEIFEGDIVTCEDMNQTEHKGEVIFENGTFCLRSLILNWKNERETCLIWKDGVNNWYSLENCYEFQIIGNLYENPDLPPLTPNYGATKQLLRCLYV